MVNSVSVILPVYNVELYLNEALESVLNQTLKNIEVICVNDGSTDNSLVVLQNYVKKDKRIKLIDQKNSGSGIARNRGLEIANGEYISFLDLDDYFSSNHALEYLYENAKINDCDMAGGNFNFIYSEYGDKDKRSVKILDEERESKGATNYCFKNDFVGSADDYKSSSWFWRFIFRREFLNKNDIRFPDYKRL